MPRRKQERPPSPAPEPPVIADAELIFRKGPNGSKIGYRARWRGPDAIAHFCVAVWTGQEPAPEVMRWIADCLSDIERNPNHRAREAFHMEARGRPDQPDNEIDVLLYVGLARKGGHTLESAIQAAAKAFHKAPATIEKMTRGMRTHTGGFQAEELTNLLSARGLALPPLAPPRKRRGRPRNTPAKK